MSEVLRVRFENNLSAVRDNLNIMGARVDNMVADSIRALLKRDGQAAREIIRRDDEIDALDLRIEEQCINLLWSQQPVAADLRVVGTAMKAITDLERIADHAVDIARITLELNQMIPPPPVVDLERLSEAALSVLREALRGFQDESIEAVQAAVSSDDAVDDMYMRARADLDAATARDPAHTVAYNRLSIVALYLERVADHGVNIAERVAYLLTGDFTQLAHPHDESL